MDLKTLMDRIALSTQSWYAATSPVLHRVAAQAAPAGWAGATTPTNHPYIDLVCLTGGSLTYLATPTSLPQGSDTANPSAAPGFSTAFTDGSTYSFLPPQRPATLRVATRTQGNTGFGQLRLQYRGLVTEAIHFPPSNAAAASASLQAALAALRDPVTGTHPLSDVTVAPVTDLSLSTGLPEIRTNAVGSATWAITFPGLGNVPQLYVPNACAGTASAAPPRDLALGGSAPCIGIYSRSPRALASPGVAIAVAGSAPSDIPASPPVLYDCYATPSFITESFHAGASAGGDAIPCMSKCGSYSCCCSPIGWMEYGTCTSSARSPSFASFAKLTDVLAGAASSPPATCPAPSFSPNSPAYRDPFASISLATSSLASAEDLAAAGVPPSLAPFFWWVTNSVATYYAPPAPVTVVQPFDSNSALSCAASCSAALGASCPSGLLSPSGAAAAPPAPPPPAPTSLPTTSTPVCVTCDSFAAAAPVDNVFILSGASPFNPTPGTDLALGLPGQCAALALAAANNGLPNIRATLTCLSTNATVNVQGITYEVLATAEALSMTAAPPGCPAGGAGGGGGSGGANASASRAPSASPSGTPSPTATPSPSPGASRAPFTVEG